MTKVVVVLTFLLFLLPVGVVKANGASTVTAVTPAEGVSFNQVSYTWPGDADLHSGTGEMDVNVATLIADTNMPSGYLNVNTTDGWVVQNLPILAGYTYTDISTTFDLGTPDGTTDTSLNAYVQYSQTPVTSEPSGTRSSFAVGTDNYNGEGVNAADTAKVPPPPPGAITFNPRGATSFCIQLNHPNIQAADSQCAPAAVANSLDWMRTTYRTPVTQPNVLGLGCGGGNSGPSDGSLVGALDVAMQRSCQDRRTGGVPTWANVLNGKICFISQNNLANFVDLKHQASATVPVSANDVTACKLTSKGNGAPTSAFILGEICAGEDVEMVYRRADGSGHVVQAIAAGRILGVPWVAFTSDHDQSDDTKGTTFIDFSFLVVSAGKLYLSPGDDGSKPEIVTVMAESPKTQGLTIPEFPSTLVTPIALVPVLMLLLIALRARFAGPRRPAGLYMVGDRWNIPAVAGAQAPPRSP